MPARDRRQIIRITSYNVCYTKLLRASKKELERLMADPKLYQEQQDKFAECSREYSSLERKLERLYPQWEEIQARIEAIESEFETLLQ